MNYEEFSPEAKQAIEHLRKYFSSLKRSNLCFYPKTSNKPDYLLFEDDQGSKFFRIEGVIHLICTTFQVENNETKEILVLAKTKQYWLSCI